MDSRFFFLGRIWLVDTPQDAISGTVLLLKQYIYIWKSFGRKPNLQEFQKNIMTVAESTEEKPLDFGMHEVHHWLSTAIHNNVPQNQREIA